MWAIFSGWLPWQVGRLVLFVLLYVLHCSNILKSNLKPVLGRRKRYFGSNFGGNETIKERPGLTIVDGCGGDVVRLFHIAVEKMMCCTSARFSDQTLQPISAQRTRYFEVMLVETCNYKKENGSNFSGWRVGWTLSLPGVICVVLRQNIQIQG